MSSRPRSPSQRSASCRSACRSPGRPTVRRSTRATPTTSSASGRCPWPDRQTSASSSGCLFLVPLSTNQPTNLVLRKQQCRVLFLCLFSLSLCFSLLLFSPLFVVVVVVSVSVSGYFLHTMFADMSTVLLFLPVCFFIVFRMGCSLLTSGTNTHTHTQTNKIDDEGKWDAGEKETTKTKRKCCCSNKIVWHTKERKK